LPKPDPLFSLLRPGGPEDEADFTLAEVLECWPNQEALRKETKPLQRLARRPAAAIALETLWFAVGLSPTC